MNNVVLIGRLTRDPELSYTPNNSTAVGRFTIAVDRPVQAGKERQADFIRITVWGKQAETCERYLTKGRQVAVMGRIQTGSYKNREGVTVYTTEVVADRVEFLGGGNSNNDGGNRGGFQRDNNATEPAAFSGLNDDFMGSDSGSSAFEAAVDEMPF